MTQISPIEAHLRHLRNRRINIQDAFLCGVPDSCGVNQCFPNEPVYGVEGRIPAGMPARCFAKEMQI